MLIQSILSEWSGQPEFPLQSDVESPIQQAYPVPYFDPESEHVMHEAVHRQSAGFRRTDRVTPLEIDHALRVGAILITQQLHLAIVDFVWSADVCGWPKRSTRRACVLEPDQWGQVLYNGRLDRGDGSSTSLYRHVVVNIQLSETPKPKAFLNCAPAHVVDFRTELG